MNSIIDEHAAPLQGVDLGVSFLAIPRPHWHDCRYIGAQVGLVASRINACIYVLAFRGIKNVGQIGNRQAVFWDAVVEQPSVLRDYFLPGLIEHARNRSSHGKQREFAPAPSSKAQGSNASGRSHAAAGASEGLLAEIRETIAAADVDRWLATPNSRLGGETPLSLVGTEREHLLRNLLIRIQSGIPT